MSEYIAYRQLASLCMAHPVMLILYAMMKSFDDPVSWVYFGLWWFWPIALLVLYRQERWRWVLPGISGFGLWFAAFLMIRNA